MNHARPFAAADISIHVQEQPAAPRPLRWAGTIWAGPPRGTCAAACYEFLIFGMKQGWACLFGGLMLGLLIGTHLFYPKTWPLARYDFLALAALAVQATLLGLRMETVKEAKVISAFHLVGTAMEIFKTSVGSWIYPEPSLLRIGGVPLFTGFMYACVGSYIARAWRVFDLRFTHHPPILMVLLLSGGIYVNFFAHHFVDDLRYPLLAATALLFRRSVVHFKAWRAHRRMPLLVGFLLVSCFIYLAENVGTFTGAWLYPSQKASWSIVSPAKLGSWYLLMIVSYALVAAINGVRPACR
jgi:uncharacterized membrane protein YoaT (DUF817 family)